jgi:hypothetical protein
MFKHYKALGWGVKEINTYGTIDLTGELPAPPPPPPVVEEEPQAEEKKARKKK